MPPDDQQGGKLESRFCRERSEDKALSPAVNHRTRLCQNCNLEDEFGTPLWRPRFDSGSVTKSLVGAATGMASAVGRAFW